MKVIFFLILNISFSMLGFCQNKLLESKNKQLTIPNNSNVIAYKKKINNNKYFLKFFNILNRNKFNNFNDTAILIVKEKMFFKFFNLGNNNYLKKNKKKIISSVKNENKKFENKKSQIDSSKIKNTSLDSLNNKLPKYRKKITEEFKNSFGKFKNSKNNYKYIYTDSNKKVSKNCLYKKLSHVKHSKSENKIEKDSLNNKSKKLIKDKLKGIKNYNYSKNDLIKVNGSIQLELINSSGLMPYTNTSPNTQNFIFDGTILIAGIPIKTDAFYSTNSKNAFQSNFFRISFDSDIIKNKYNNINKNFETQAKDYNKELTEQKQKYVSELHNMTIYENYYNNKKSYFERKLKSQIDEINKVKKDTLLDYINNDNYSIDAKILKLDSIKKNNIDFNYINFLELKNILNTQKKIIKLDSCINTSNFNKEQVLKKWEIDSLMLKNKIIDEKTRVNNLQNGLNNIRPYQILNSIKGFQIGLVTPDFSDLSISGITLKGIDMKFELKSWEFELFKGKTFSINAHNSNILNYNNKTNGIQITNNFFKNKVYFNITNFDEINGEKFTNDNTTIFGTGSYLDVFNCKLKGKLDFAYLFKNKQENVKVEKNFIENGDNLKINEKKFSQIKNVAVKGNLVYTSNKIGTLKLEYKNVQPGFQNSLTPFLRNDFCETQFQWNNKYFKNMLLLKANYKLVIDNLHNFKPNTNKIKGCGVEARCQFLNGLMIGIQYQPYDLSNNSPDTLFRTKNKFSVFQANSTLTLNKKRGVYIISLLSMLNNTDYTGILSKTYNICFMSNILLNDKFVFDINFNSNFVKKGNDSLNNSTLGINAGIKKVKIKKTYTKLLSQSSMIKYKSGKYLYQSGLTTNTYLNNGIIVSFSSSAGINNFLFSENQKYFYSVLFTIKLPLNYKIKQLNFKKNKKNEIN